VFNGENKIELSSSTKVANLFIASWNAKFPRKPEHYLVINMKKNTSGHRKEHQLAAFVPHCFPVMTDQRQPLRM
jgi:hypothetical protein